MYLKYYCQRQAMNSRSLFLFFFFVLVAAIVMKEGAIDAGRVLKMRNIATVQANKNPCDHHNVPNGDYDVRNILKSKLPSVPSPGVGHKYIDSLSPLKMKTSKASNTLKINKLPSGLSEGVGHKYINAEGLTKRSIVPSQKLITIAPFNNIPSGPVGRVGHNYND